MRSEDQIKNFKCLIKDTFLDHEPNSGLYERIETVPSDDPHARRRPNSHGENWIASTDDKCSSELKNGDSKTKRMSDDLHVYRVP